MKPKSFTTLASQTSPSNPTATAPDRTRARESHSRARVPQPLDAGRVRELQQNFLEALQPVGTVESLLVEQAAKSAALVELMRDWELLIAQGFDESELPPKSLLFNEQDVHADHWSVNLKLNTLNELSRSYNSHLRQFCCWLQQFQKLSQLRRSRTSSLPEMERPDEQDCVERLRQRFLQPDWACPKCNHRAGDWIASHKCWECRQCHRQTCLRTGTVMEGSPLPISVWVWAYLLLRENPEISTATLSEQLQIKRLDTIRHLRRTLLPHLEDPSPLGGLV